MAELTEHSNEISANGTNFWIVRRNVPATVSVDFPTQGTAGEIAIQNSQGNPYTDPTNSFAAISVDHETPETHVVYPTGGHIYFVSTNFNGAVAKIYVEQPSNA